MSIILSVDTSSKNCVSLSKDGVLISVIEENSDPSFMQITYTFL